jgi:predicted aspartyl protease
MIINFKHLIFLLCFIGLTNINAQSIGNKKGYITDKEYYAEVEYEYIESKIILPVKVDGITYRFILDTGAPNIISSRIAEKIKIKELDSISVNDANGTSKSMKFISIPKFEIGNISFYNTKSLIQPKKENDIFDCFNIDGFIGSNVLNTSVLQIVSKQKKIIITNDVKKLNLNKKNSNKLKLVGSQKSPYIWLKLGNNGENQVLLDTGMEGSYDIALRTDSALVKKNVYQHFSSGYGTSGLGLFGSGNNKEHHRIIINKIKLANTIFKNILGETTTDDNSRIGSDFFEKGTATFDFKKKRFYFDSYSKNPSLSKSIMDLSPKIKDDKMVVGIIWSDSLKSKFSIDDEIVKVNGVMLSSIPFCKFINEPSIFQSENELLLEIKSKNGEITRHTLNRYLPSLEN